VTFPPMATLSVEDLSMDERKAQIEAIITYAVQDGSLAAMTHAGHLVRSLVESIPAEDMLSVVSNTVLFSIAAARASATDPLDLGKLHHKLRLYGCCQPLICQPSVPLADQKLDSRTQVKLSSLYPLANKTPKNVDLPKVTGETPLPTGILHFLWYNLQIH